MSEETEIIGDIIIGNITAHIATLNLLKDNQLISESEAAEYMRAQAERLRDRAPIELSIGPWMLERIAEGVQQSKTSEDVARSIRNAFEVYDGGPSQDDPENPDQ